MIRFLAIVEAGTVTGPAKNVLEFCRCGRNLEGGSGLQPVIATFERSALASGPHSTPFVQATREAGIPLLVIPERFLFDPQIISNFRRLVAELSPHFVQTHGVKSHFVVRVSGVWRKCPWIAFHHGYTTESWRMRFYNQLNRWSLRSPACIVTVCEPFKDMLASRGAPRDRIAVVHNAVGPDWFLMRGSSPSTQLALRALEDERLILVVGRLSNEKGHADLVAGLHQLQNLRPDMRFRLIVLGEGPERGRLQQLASTLKLQDKISFVGHVADARPYYQISDLLVIPSASEGSPNVLLEAMAAGLPVVATAVGGIPEMVTHGQQALLIPPHDPVAMAQAMILLLADRALAEKLASSARNLAATRFSCEQRARTLLELYGKVLRVAATRT